MSYEGTLNKIMQYVPPALDLLFEEYAEVMVSLDRTSVVQALTAKMKLDLPDLKSEQDAFNALERAFAELLASEKLKAKAFGYSSLGAEEVQGLFRKYIVPQSTQLAADDFSDIVDDWRTLPADVINEKRKDSAWLSRFNAAVMAGAI